MDNRTLEGNIIGSHHEYFDWRQTPNILTPVLNQGSCGCCWAFAATSLVESRYAISGGGLVQLSVQEILDNYHKSYTPGHQREFDLSGCHVLHIHDALRYIMERGVCKEADMPYQKKRVDRETDFELPDKAPVSIRRIVSIAIGDEAALLKAIKEQPVGCSIMIGEQFHTYKNGVYKQEEVVVSNSNSLGAHAVLIVGYGIEDSGEEYFIIKNSWSSDWGQGGYAKIERKMVFDACYVEVREPILALKSNISYSVDWRGREGVLTPVRNQLKCSCGWAFVATALVETTNAIFNPGMPVVHLSCQELLDYYHLLYTPRLKRKFGQNGSYTVSVRDALRYIMNYKISKEIDYPYKGRRRVWRDQNFQFPAKAPIELKKIIIIRDGDKDLLLQTVKKQPVACMMMMDERFVDYKDGVYRMSELSSRIQWLSVMIVGLGEDQSGEMYLEIKNSWGIKWGDKGYAKIGIELVSHACYIEVAERCN